MSQLDNIPPIRRPQFTPFPMEDAFRGVSDTFKIRTPEPPPLIPRKAGVGPPHSFKPTKLSGGKIRIAPGFVNTIPVEGADETEWSTGTPYTYWVAVTVDSGGLATAAEVGRGATVPDDTPTLAHQPLFDVDAVGAVIAQHVVTSLRHQKCGANVHLFGGLG